MRRTDHEHLIERYLGGMMSGAEEEEFFMQVAIDSNLRQTLKAYRIVESALRKHRDSIPAEHSQSRLRLVAMLGATASAPETAGSSDVAPSTSRRPAAAGPRRWSAQATIAGVCIATALLLWNGPADTHDAPHQTPQRTESQPPASLTTIPDEPATQPPSAGASSAAENMPSGTLSEPISRSNVLRSASPSVGESAREHRTTVKTPAATVDSAIVRQTQTGTALRAEPTKPHVNSQDTIRMRMRIMLPDEKK